jgi:V8-like Glu-specific endopeptidase
MAQRKPASTGGGTAHEKPSQREINARKKVKEHRRANPLSVVEDKDPHEHMHWDFPVEFPLHPGEHGLPESLDHPHEVDLESICGGIDDSQPVEQYDGTLGVSVNFVNAHQGPVGQLQWNDNLAALYTNPGNVSGVRWCTGTLIANDLFISAGHCFDQTGDGWQRPLVNGTTNVIQPAEIATNMHVNFNFQVDPNGNLRTEQRFAVVQLVEYRLNGLDYAIVRLAGNPGATWGTTQISATDAVDGDMLCIIQHPAGLPKRIEGGPAFHLHDVQVGYDSIDTLGGSSGAGILRAADGLIVGVHTNGGCSAAAMSHNHGVRITSIVAASPVVQGLTAPKLKFADDPGGVKKAVDDPPKFKFTDDPPGGIKKAVDDPPKFKFRDDAPGGIKKAVDDPPKFKFADEGGPKLPGDVKAGGFDPGPDPTLGRVFSARGSRLAPFILATPHHSMAWAGGQAAGGPAAHEAALAELEQALALLQQRIDEGAGELATLQAQYEALLAEYQAAARQRGGPAG